MQENPEIAGLPIRWYEKPVRAELIPGVWQMPNEPTDRYFYDCEFIEDSKRRTIDLISIGVVAEDGRKFYAINAACDWSKANDWVRVNVLAPMGIRQLTYGDHDGVAIVLDKAGGSWSVSEESYQYFMQPDWIAVKLLEFLKYHSIDRSLKLSYNPDRDMRESNIYHYLKALEVRKKIELWAYYADYDHVSLCWLFGDMIDLPTGLPMWTRDIQQLADFLGNPTLPPQPKKQHHALSDAEWNYQAWKFLKLLQEERYAVYPSMAYRDR